MMKSNTLELISGAYTGVLWDTIEDVLTNENSPAHVHDVLKVLHGRSEDKAAFAFVRILYDVAGIVLPDVVEALDRNDETRSAYIAELLGDIENII